MDERSPHQDRSFAEQLHRNSFATMVLPEETQIKLETLAKEAEIFFVRSEKESPEFVKRYQHVVSTHLGGSMLHGYAEPSQAKQLFRYFPGDEKSRKESQSSSDVVDSDTQFPLPVSLLSACQRELQGILEEKLAAALNGANCRSTGQSGKHLSFRDLHAEAVKASRGKISDPGCPLDIFRYKNEMVGMCSATSVPASVNCSAHVDRGLMHIIVESSPGLQVYNPTSGHFQLIDDINQKQLNIGEKEYSNEFECGRSKNRKHSAKMPSDRPPSPPISCFRRAIIITNSALQELTLEHADDETGLVLPACVHQVVGVVGTPRLSISLELRLPL